MSYLQSYIYKNWKRKLALSISNLNPLHLEFRLFFQEPRQMQSDEDNK